MKKIISIVLCMLLVISFTACKDNGTMEVTSDFEGGNITIVQQTEEGYLLEIDNRDSLENWFYWNFCVKGAQGKTVRFDFKYDSVGSYGPAISRDGINYAFETDKLKFSYKYFTYTFSKKEDIVYFSFSLPYTVKNYNEFLKTISEYEVKETILTQTKAGTDVPILTFGEGKEGDIVLSSRHHACESVASYVLEGIISEALTNQELLSRYKFHVLPFADIDGVIKGDQGKARAPHDHNRDYIENNIYPEIKAWMNHLKTLNVVGGIDLHCPLKWGGESDYMAFIYKHTHDDYRLAKYLNEICLEQESEIVHELKYDLKAGQSWNTSTTGLAAQFYASLGAAQAFSIEIPYFGLKYKATVNNAREYGRNFTKALDMYYVKSE